MGRQKTLCSRRLFHHPDTPLGSDRTLGWSQRHLAGGYQGFGPRRPQIARLVKWLALRLQLATRS